MDMCLLKWMLQKSRTVLIDYFTSLNVDMHNRQCGAKKGKNLSMIVKIVIIELAWWLLCIKESHICDVCKYDDLPDKLTTVCLSYALKTVFGDV